jgi:hypothetical protein
MPFRPASIAIGQRGTRKNLLAQATRQYLRNFLDFVGCWCSLCLRDSVVKALPAAGQLKFKSHHPPASRGVQFVRSRNVGGS